MWIMKFLKNYRPTENFRWRCMDLLDMWWWNIKLHGAGFIPTAMSTYHMTSVPPAPGQSPSSPHIRPHTTIIIMRSTARQRKGQMCCVFRCGYTTLTKLYFPSTKGRTRTTDVAGQTRCDKMIWRSREYRPDVLLCDEARRHAGRVWPHEINRAAYLLNQAQTIAAGYGFRSRASVALLFAANVAAKRHQTVTTARHCHFDHMPFILRQTHITRTISK